MGTINYLFFFLISHSQINAFSLVLKIIQKTTVMKEILNSRKLKSKRKIEGAIAEILIVVISRTNLTTKNQF